MASEAESNNRLGGLLEKLILGIDPGSKITGYALIEVPAGIVASPRLLKVRDAGVFRVDPSLGFTEKLGLLHRALYHVVSIHQPSASIFEKPFYGKNVSTTIRLAETRGALMAACARERIEIHEITPAEVKKIVTGSGQADKNQVALGLKSLLQFDVKDLPYDAADAVAIAFSYCMRMTSIKDAQKDGFSRRTFANRLMPSVQNFKSGI